MLNYFTPKKKTIHHHNHDPNLIKESLNLELEEKSKNSLHLVMLLGVKRIFSLERLNESLKFICFFLCLSHRSKKKTPN